MRDRKDTRTLSLLDWEPPAPVRAFAPEQVRAASLRAQIAKALAVALKEDGRSREEIAAEAGAYLGEDFPKNMLDAYAAESREDHVINVVRLVALLHATGDRRMLQLLAEPFGWAVIDAKFLPAIEVALLDDKKRELEQAVEIARRKMRAGR